MNKLQEMTSFVAVGDVGSFVGAADLLGLSKAAVSRHVSDLEHRVGVRLLHRTTRRLSLTSEGLQFHARCKALLAEVDAAESEISVQGSEPVGRVRVNAPVSFGILHLAPLWGRFIEQHPRVTLDVALNDRIVDLVDEGFDLAVRITRMKDSTLISRKLASTRLILCASPRYLERHGTPRHPDELARHQTIAYSYMNARGDWHFEGPDGPKSVRINPHLEANDGNTCRAAALDHQGIIREPDFIVGEDIRRGDLVPLMPDYHAGEIGIYAVYPSRQYLPLKVRSLVDFLAGQFRQPSWSLY